MCFGGQVCCCLLGCNSLQYLLMARCTVDPRAATVGCHCCCRCSSWAAHTAATSGSRRCTSSLPQTSVASSGLHQQVLHTRRASCCSDLHHIDNLMLNATMAVANHSCISLPCLSFQPSLHQWHTAPRLDLPFGWD
jgi:hypothetical protein